MQPTSPDRHDSAAALEFRTIDCFRRLYVADLAVSAQTAPVVRRILVPMTEAELILDRIDQRAYEAGLQPAEPAHTVRVWQVAPIRTEWTAVLPVAPGHEDEVRARDFVGSSSTSIGTTSRLRRAALAAASTERPLGVRSAGPRLARSGTGPRGGPPNSAARWIGVS
ncbi:hypothetical protein [Nannocystis exedens]|uniref:hypothetical protein n=1 Tax=Nannocystis exedens TaxID=54 RepID=UPI000C2B184B|nr:hypothetical protein [Nannocystis exedens]